MAGKQEKKRIKDANEAAKRGLRHKSGMIPSETPKKPKGIAVLTEKEIKKQNFKEAAKYINSLKLIPTYIRDSLTDGERADLSSLASQRAYVLHMSKRVGMPVSAMEGSSAYTGSQDKVAGYYVGQKPTRMVLDVTRLKDPNYETKIRKALNLPLNNG